MPLDLANIVNDTAAAVIPYGGSEVKVNYRPAKITTRAIEEMDVGDDGVTTFILEVVKSWDVLANKKKVPLTKTALGDLPIPFTRAIVLGILKDRGDNAGEAEGNSKGS